MLKEVRKKKAVKTKDFTKPGKPLTELEFVAMVNESEESGYMPLEEFKKKCQMLLNSR